MYIVYTNFSPVWEVKDWRNGFNNNISNDLSKKKKKHI